MNVQPSKYCEWLESIPETLKNDPLWNQEAYRLALFASDIAWPDATKFLRDGRTLQLSSQIYRAVGSVGANIAEGYSRCHAKDRARFYEYALGSARETRTWYFQGRHVLGEQVALHRLQLLTQIIRLLLAMLPPTRGYALHEGGDSSAIEMKDDGIDWPLPLGDLTPLLKDVPYPEP